MTLRFSWFSVRSEDKRVYESWLAAIRAGHLDDIGLEPAGSPGFYDKSDLSVGKRRARLSLHCHIIVT